MILYNYHRSSAAYRVRIVLNLKRIDHEIVTINLLEQEHKSAHYKTKQPQGLVPCLEIESREIESQEIESREIDNQEIESQEIKNTELADSKTGDSQFISQSGAIIQYLDVRYPQPPLYSTDPLFAAKQRGLVDMIACDIHPLNNLRILQYLTKNLHIEEDEKMRWYHHWINEGFIAIEQQLSAQPYSCGAQVSIVDVYLIPQVYNALRFKLDMSPYPKILSVYNACNQLLAFKDAEPKTPSH